MTPFVFLFFFGGGRGDYSYQPLKHVHEPIKPVMKDEYIRIDIFYNNTQRVLSCIFANCSDDYIKSYSKYYIITFQRRILISGLFLSILLEFAH